MPRPREIVYPSGLRAKIIWRRGLKSHGVAVHGYCLTDPADGRIWIDSARPVHMQAAALVHELLHRSTAPLVRPEKDYSLEESIVRTLERNIVGTWRLNPEMFEWIHEALTGGSIE